VLFQHNEKPPATSLAAFCILRAVFARLRKGRRQCRPPRFHFGIDVIFPPYLRFESKQFGVIWQKYSPVKIKRSRARSFSKEKT